MNKTRIGVWGKKQNNRYDPVTLFCSLVKKEPAQLRPDELKVEGKGYFRFVGLLTDQQQEACRSVPYTLKFSVTL